MYGVSRHWTDLGAELDRLRDDESDEERPRLDFADSHAEGERNHARYRPDLAEQAKEVTQGVQQAALQLPFEGRTEEGSRLAFGRRGVGGGSTLDAATIQG